MVIGVEKAHHFALPLLQLRTIIPEFLEKSSTKRNETLHSEKLWQILASPSLPNQNEINPRPNRSRGLKKKTKNTEDTTMKNLKATFAIAAVAVTLFAFAPANEAQAKSNFSISIGGHGGGFTYGQHHGHSHFNLNVPVQQVYYPAPRQVWVPGYYVGHGCHAHYVPGHYEYVGGYYPY